MNKNLEEILKEITRSLSRVQVEMMNSCGGGGIEDKDEERIKFERKRLKKIISQALTNAYQAGVEEGKKTELKEKLSILPRKFWEDEDHAVGGYISKKDLFELLNELNTQKGE